MRVLILGGTGMLGRAVTEEGRRRELAVEALSEGRVDIRDRAGLQTAAEGFGPEVIINCAALTQVDQCEERREEALDINGRGVGEVVAVAEALDAHLVHISTDYVFDGEATTPYLEDDAPAPRSVYGATKLEGERRALRYPGSLVLRSSWLFGPGGPNFVKTMTTLMDRDEGPLRVVDDQVGCPTYTRSLARAIYDVVPSRPTGLLHYRDQGPVSWHDFATEIGRQWRSGIEIQAVDTAAVPRPAPRPAYSVLDVSRFESLTGRGVESWSEGLTEYLGWIRSTRSER